jgi:hypothetical protein
MPAVVYSPEAFAGDLTRLIKASQLAQNVRAALLTTRDRDQALNMVKSVINEIDAPLYHFGVSQQRAYRPASLTWEPMPGRAATDPPELLRRTREITNGVVIFDDCLRLLRDDGGDPVMRMTLMQMLSCETRTEGGLTLIFLEAPEAERYLPSVLCDQFVRLEVTYPRAPELEGIAREEIALAAHRARKPLDVQRIRSAGIRLGSELVGLTRSAARDALRDALAPDPLAFDAAAARLQYRKALQLSRKLAMNVLDTRDAEEPIGLDYLMEYLEIAREQIRVVGPGRARGVLLIGPAGTGKTMLAKAVGRLVGLPVVEVRVAALMNSLLGATEGLFAQLFDTLQAMSPNVAFFDEFEKIFSDSSERDGGTMMRCTGSMLSWLSDNPDPNFIVATSNSLTRMGEIGLTIARSGRFDRLFFVDVPNRRSRQLMLERWLKAKTDNPTQAAQEIAEMTEKFSGADLSDIVKQAAARAAYNHQPLTIQLLKAEAERKRMRAMGLYNEFQPLREWGCIHCDPAGPTDE